MINVNRGPILADGTDAALSIDELGQRLLRQAVLTPEPRFALLDVVAWLAVAVASGCLTGAQGERVRRLDLATSCAPQHAVG
jgi:hypothetical protein